MRWSDLVPVVCAAFPLAARCDVVTLFDGTQYSGQVVFDHHDYLVIVLDEGGRKAIRRENVRSVAWGSTITKSDPIRPAPVADPIERPVIDKKADSAASIAATRSSETE